MLDTVYDVINAINGVAFSDPVLYVILGTGVLFTLWTALGQRKAVTHGLAILRGKYDDPNDPGAINHFQALSTALSGTVGLGNIGGVAIAIELGGPGAVLWMWAVGLFGMAVKMTEVTQSMLYRNTDDPANPHGGPMFVAAKGFAGWGLAGLGRAVGILFAITLMVATITTPMFQSWNVADTTQQYFGVPTWLTGGVIVLVVGAVLLGGIRWIGRVTGTIVPFMCLAYLIAAVVVLAFNVAEIPGLLALIVKSGLPEFLGGEPAAAGGAFLGGTFGAAFAWGMKRALYSSEAGQGSAPMAHSAVKTDEPVREGVVAGLEPLIDTLIVCTMTALVILSTGALEREPEAFLDTPPQVVRAVDDDGQPASDDDGVPLYTVAPIPVADLPDRSDAATDRLGRGDVDYADRDAFSYVVVPDGGDRTLLKGQIKNGLLTFEPIAAATPFTTETDADGRVPVFGGYNGSTLTAHAFDRQFAGLGRYLITVVIWMFAISTVISWGYYGEQGIVFLGNGHVPGWAITVYKLVYLLAVVVATWPGFITGTTQIAAWSELGLGVMLLVNIPLILIFGKQAMDAYHNYTGRLKRGEMLPDR